MNVFVINQHRHMSFHSFASVIAISNTTATGEPKLFASSRPSFFQFLVLFPFRQSNHLQQNPILHFCHTLDQ
jgi:hypothetical protein